MNLSIATNWDMDLIEALSAFPVRELFGSLPDTPVGSGRPSFLLGNTTPQDAGKFIQAVHAKGWAFNYLLNAPCMSNMEFDKDTHHNLIQHLEWLCELGVDTITVSIPYLLQIIKRQFPQLKVKISVIAHVNSVIRARFFEEMGADEITIDYMQNRDFRFLKQIRNAVKCRLTLLVNDLCLYQCPYRTYHYNTAGHASQDWHPRHGFYIDYCIISCTIQKFGNPAQLIKARWIRPEDLERYEAIGYTDFKIGGRRMTTAWLQRAAAAYAQRRYDGNLMEIMDGVKPGVDPDMRAPRYEIMVTGSQSLQAENMAALASLSPANLVVDNKKLEGFLDYFEKQDCLDGCVDCRYCDTIAEKVIHTDAQENRQYIAALTALQNDLISSRIFNSPLPQEPLEWDAQTRKEFVKILGYIPKPSRAIAKQSIAVKAGALARKRQANVITREDMVKAFLESTPAAYKANVIKSMKAVGIDPDLYRV